MTSVRAWLACGAASAAAVLSGGCGENPTLRPGPPPQPRAAADAGPAAAPKPPSASPAANPAARPPARKGPWPLSFLARRQLALPGKPACLFGGDLDGDGRDELAVALQSPGRLLVWRGSAAGLAREPVALATGGWPVGIAAIADPADARRRVLVVAAREPSVVELIALGADGTLARRAAVELAAPPVALAGVRDGRAVVATRDDRLWLVPLDGSTTATSFSLPSGRACCALVTSAGDLAIGFQGTRELALWQSASWLQPGERAPSQLYPLGAVPRALLEYDIDGDAKAELVACGGDRGLWVIGADGSRVWQSSGLVPLALASADLDGDQRAELVSLAGGDSAFGVQAQFGANGAGLTLSEYAGQTPVALALGRFDADARIDLAIANRDALAVSVLSGTGLVKEKKQAFYQAARTPVGRNPVALAAGQFGGDGASEVLALNAGSGDLSLLDNEFGLLRARPPVPAGPSPRALVALEFDGDGATDAAWLVDDARAAKLCIARGDGKGGLLAVQTLEVGTSATDLVAGNLDDDKSLELVALDRDGNHYRCIDWDAAARAPKVIHERGLARPVRAVLADWDADGRNELVLAAYDRGFNTPNSPLVVGKPMPPKGDAVEALDSLNGSMAADYRPQALCSADCDGDGRTDLVVLASNGQANASGRIALVLNRASGDVLADVVETGLLPARAWAGDLDGDGLADVAVASQNSHLAQVWLARKTQEGVKLERQSDLGAGLGPLDVLGVDLNVDGAIDLVVANNFSDDVSALYDVPPK